MPFFKHVKNWAKKISSVEKQSSVAEAAKLVIAHAKQKQSFDRLHPEIHRMATLRRSLGSFLRREDEEEENPLAMSDQEILEKIYETHLHNDDPKFDTHSLFTIVDIILRHSTHIVDNVVQGTPGVGTHQHIDVKTPQSSFTSPLSTLKQISSEMCCKPPGEEIAHRTTMSILNKLSSYPWEAKAVLTMAAFALEYGDFWWLSQIQLTDALAKSVAILKRVPLLTKPSAVREHCLAIDEVNNMIKAALQVIEAIFEVEKLTSYDTKDVPALAPAMDQIPVDVYWAIITVVACITQINCLTTDSEKRQELSYFGQKTKIVLSKLRKQITLCHQQIEEAEYQKLRELWQTPTEILEVLKFLIFPRDAPQSLFDGATKLMVNIDVLRRKNVYLFISTLDITEEEISILLPIYESIKTNEHYKIVWIPIVEEWNEQLRKKFEFLKTKMPWYVVQQFGSIVAGFRYIKEEWEFKKKPMVVVLNPQGKVQHTIAFHLIQVHGMKAFPSITSDQDRIDREINWVGSVAGNIHPTIDTWMKEQKYIFFYGGKDKGWIQMFTKYANSLLDEAIIKRGNIAIEFFCVEKDKSLIGRFWNGIESMFLTKDHKTADAVVPEEVQKMLSYKNESGWALLIKGSSVVLCGNGATMLKTVAEFENWKWIMMKKGFELSVKEYHERIKAYQEMIMRSSSTRR